MKTKTSIFDVRAKDRKVEIVAGRRDGEQVDIVISPTKAFAFYQQLMGRREVTRARAGSNGETVSVTIHNFVPRNNEENGEEKKEIEGKRIVVKKGDERITAVLLSSTGSILLAEEFRKATKKAVEEGGKIEIASGDFYALVDKSGMRVGYKDVPVFIPMRSLVVLRVAVQGGYQADLGELSWNGKRFFLRGKELSGDGENTLRGLIEVMG